MLVTIVKWWVHDYEVITLISVVLQEIIKYHSFILAFEQIDEPFMYVPYFLGWYSKASAQLPTSMLVPSPTGTGTDTYPITYEFDEDGYVVKMSWDAEWVEYVF